MKAERPHNNSRTTTRLVRRRIEQGGERLWRYTDFAGLPITSVAQALSRLTRAGLIERLSRGTYYRTRQTAFGPSRPNPADIRKLISAQRTIFPAGLAAANLLGFTTQNPKRIEVATIDDSLPRKLIGSDTIVHRRRPVVWASLSDIDAALLDFLRRAGKNAELSRDETAQRLLALISENNRFERLMKVAHSEPPRVRAMLGAIGQQMGKGTKLLDWLRATLNPLSRFDFGKLDGLRYAREWQAKERSRRETV